MALKSANGKWCVPYLNPPLHYPKHPTVKEAYEFNMRALLRRINIGTVTKRELGTELYYFILQLAGEQYAPKITGMFIELDLNEIRRNLSNIYHFLFRLNQAYRLIQPLIVSPTVSVV